MREGKNKWVDRPSANRKEKCVKRVGNTVGNILHDKPGLNKPFRNAEEKKKEGGRHASQGPEEMVPVQVVIFYLVWEKGKR